MREIYLIRHGQPEFPGPGRYCLGSLDLPLSPLGRMQACILARALREKELTVFSSPLSRALDTARALSPRPAVIDGLREMHAGDWEGLSFKEIKERWPQLYEARGKDPLLPIPNAEDFHAGQRRFLSAVNQALSQSRGSIAIVAHATVISSLLCHASGSEQYRSFEYRPDHCAWYKIILDDEGVMRLELPRQRPGVPADRELCLELMEAIRLPGHIREHCRAVSEEALRIAAELERAGLALNRADIECAALLHDIARLYDMHPQTGAEWLKALGYERLAAIVRQHHELESAETDEAAAVYMADKLIQGAAPVSLAERFEKSREKCKDPRALAAHERRAAQAGELAGKINRLCGKEIIK